MVVVVAFCRLLVSVLVSASVLFERVGVSVVVVAVEIVGVGGVRGWVVVVGEDVCIV